MTPFSIADQRILGTLSMQGIGLAIARATRAIGAYVIFHGKESAASTLPPKRAIYLAGELLEADGATPLITLGQVGRL